MPRLISIPLLRASSTFGLMPTAITIRSASATSPSANSRPFTLFLPRMASDCFFRRNFIPCSSSSLRSITDAASSNWRSIIYSWIWTTDTSIPRCKSPLAASSPSSPPPITSAFRWVFAVSCIIWVSLMSRNAITPSFSAPGSGSMNGLEPVARISSS